MKQAISNIGTKLYMTAVGVAPKASDLLTDLVNVGTPGGVQTSDVTYNDVTSGWTKHIGTVRDNSAMTVQFACTSEESFNRVRNQAVGTPTGSTEFLRDFYIVYPKRADWAGTMGFKVTGYIQQYTPGDISSDSYQNITFTIQPSGGIEPFNDIIGTISGITGSPTSVEKSGGAVTITVAGTDLSDGIFIQGTDEADGRVTGQTTGTNTSQVAKVVIPINAGTSQKTWTFKASLNNGATYEAESGTVTQKGTEG